MHKLQAWAFPNWKTVRLSLEIEKNLLKKKEGTRDKGILLNHLERGHIEKKNNCTEIEIILPFK